MPLINPVFKHQVAFTDYIRMLKEPDFEQSHPHRLKHYRRLVKNVFDDTLQHAFPITFKILDKEQWNWVIEDFIANYSCSSPQAWRMSFDFYEYIKSANIGQQIERPYLEDLTYFEWLELDVHTMDDRLFPQFKEMDKGHIYNMNDFKEHRFFINPYFQICQLEYPVHSKCYDKLLEHKGSYQILLYRDMIKYKVHFLELSPLFALVFDNTNLKFIDLSTQFTNAIEMLGLNEMINVDTALQNSIVFLNDMIQRDFILGYK